MTELPFEQVWFVDFEFIPKPGEHPDVVCLCAKELRSGQTLRLWRNQLGSTPPYRIDAGALFVCFAATAEVACHLALGWPVPEKILDLSPVFRCLVNGREKMPEGRGLLGALAYFGLNSIGAKRKDAMRNRVIQGWPFSQEEQEQILDYCLSDIDALEALLSKLSPHIDLDTALHWSEFAAVSAVMEHRGVPIDMEIFSQMQDKQAWAFVRDAVVPKIDAQYGVYQKGADGEWHFSSTLFEQYLARAGIDWPRLESGKLNLRRKTFEGMSKNSPELEPLRQLRYTRDKLRRIKLAVGVDGRNRTVLWPFASKTGRTQPKASEWIFSPAVWLRGLIKPGPGRAVAYIDWAGMEFQIAAVRSGDQNMLKFYASGQPYIEFAKCVDQAPADATKKTHGEVHETYKTTCLGTQYGMQTETLAQRLGVSTFVAYEMLNQHHGLLPQFWAWRDDWIAHALSSGVMSTNMGWTCRTGITEFNERSIGNWPIQSAGGDILRIACVWLHRRDIKLCGPIHDAVLIEASIDQIEAVVALVQEIMRRASRVVLGPYELRTDATIVRYPDRYCDKRGQQMWTEVLDLLAQYRRQKTKRIA